MALTPKIDYRFSDIPPGDPPLLDNWEKQDIFNCDHDFKPSIDREGVFQWKCRECEFRKPADPLTDRPYILARVKQLKQQYDALQKKRERGVSATEAKDLGNAVRDVCKAMFANAKLIDVDPFLVNFEKGINRSNPLEINVAQSVL